MKQVLALDPREREKECEHKHRPYRARFGMPCTGPRVCSMCGTYFYDDGTSETPDERRARLERPR